MSRWDSHCVRRLGNMQIYILVVYAQATVNLDRFLCVETQSQPSAIPAKHDLAKINPK